MIPIRIPKDIRDYKEKIVAGLTFRHLGCILFAVSVGGPIVYFNREKLTADAIGYIVFLLAIPVILFAVYTVQGMPFEKFATEIISYFRAGGNNGKKFVSKNAFRGFEAEYDEDYRNEKEKLPLEKVRLASYERSYLMYRAIENGENVNYRELDGQLKLVRTGRTPDGKKPNKNPKTDRKKRALEKLKAQVDAINAKRASEPLYIYNKREMGIMKKYAEMKEKAEIAERKAAVKVIKLKDEKMKKRRFVPTSLSKTVQQAIPYVADYEDGLFETEKNVYSKVYLVRDVNYVTSKQEEQESILAMYSEFLNWFSEEYTIGVCVDTRIVSADEQENKIMYKMTGDENDGHRREYNRIMRKQIEKGRNNMVISKYITVTIDCATPVEAVMRFSKIDIEVEQNLLKLGSGCTVLSTDERLELLHDKFRKGREGDFKINYEAVKKAGVSTKDYIAPASIVFDRKHFKIEDEYYRCMYLNNLPSVLDDCFFSEMVDNDFPLTATISIQPIAQDKGVKIVKKRLTGMETNKIEAQKRAVRGGYSPEIINHNLQQSIEEAAELLEDVTRKSQKMFYVTLLFMVSAPSLDELENRCKILENKARKQTCQLQKLEFQQETAFKVTLPCGVPPKGKLFVDRVLTSESTAVFIPFSCQEMFQPSGFYYGLNQISRNLIFLDRTKLLTPSGFLLGSSGSGKSFATKREIINVLLKDNHSSVLIIDPENEYTEFVNAFSGTVVNVSTDSDTHINPMEMTENYGLDETDEFNISVEKKKSKAIKKKSEYIMSIVECMMSMDSNQHSIITPQQKTIVDRCVNRCYKAYLDHDFDLKYLPTLVSLQDELDREKEKSDEGRQIAEAAELYTRGNMDLFSHRSNVRLNNRMVSFNIRDLGGQLKSISLLIVLDFIWNRMTENNDDGVKTYCYADEIHILFQNDYSARFLQQLYKRGRKYGLVITGITQDVEDLLRSEMARGMLSNSDFIMMLNQKAENLKLLTEMLKISDAQAAYVNNAPRGSGLIFANSVVVPFMDKFPHDSYLYKLMSTNFDEKVKDFV